MTQRRISPPAGRSARVAVAELPAADRDYTQSFGAKELRLFGRAPETDAAFTAHLDAQ